MSPRRPVRSAPRPALRRRGRPTAALLVLVALTAALAGPLSTPAAARTAGRPSAAGTAARPAVAPAPPAADADPLALHVDDLRPHAPQPGDDLQVLATLGNTSGAALTGLQLRVLVGPRLSTRSELAAADADPRGGAVRHTLDLPDLPPTGQAPLDLRVPVDDLRLGDPGVYPLQLEVRGSAGGAGRARLGSVSTFLPWFADTPVDPLRIAWLWPLVAAPTRDPRELQLGDDLAAQLQPAGRLARSLAAARTGEAGACPVPPEPSPGRTQAPPPAPTCRPVPVTYAVDPDLVYTVQAMTAPYAVKVGATQVVPGAGVGDATAWFTSLQQATAAGAVLALPYADPDVVALTRASADLGGEVAAARAYGTTVTRELLGAEPLDTVAYPPPGPLSDAALEAVTTPATRAVVLSPEALVTAPGGRATPSARVALPGPVRPAVSGLVPDAALSALLVPDRPQDPRLAEQRWLVETALIAAELPNRGRTLLVAPPRRGAVDPAVAGQAVADTGRLPWLCPVALAAVAAGSESCPLAPAPARDDPPEVDLAPPGPDTPTLSPSLVDGVARTRAAADQLTGAVIKGGTEQAQATRARLQRALLRSGSSAWRDDPASAARFLRLAAAEVAELRAKVSVLGGRVLLTSNNGQVSVAVVNELDQPVTVSVSLRAPADARLSRARTDVLEVPARTSSSVAVDATTLTSGRFVVKAQLLDRDGRPFGDPQDLVVRSTRYGTVALAVTGLGAAVLLVAAGVRLVRRAWRRRGAGGGSATLSP